MNFKVKCSIPILISVFLLLLALKASPIPAVKATGPEDMYEENDTFATAANITWGFYQLTLFDEDYFRINVSAGDIIHIQLQSNISVENVELEVYNSSYGFIKGTYTYNEFEELFISVPEKDFYVIRVYSADGYYFSDYNITVNKYLPGQIDDKFDNGVGNDIIDNASPIWPNFYSDLILNDSDYYTVHVMPNEDLDVYIYFNPALSWIDFDIYNQTGFQIGSGVHEEMNYVHIYLTATGEEQNLTIHVWEAPFSGYSYDMDIWVYGTGPSGDWAEPNDYIEEAYILSGPGFYGGLYGNVDDVVDYFGIMLHPGDFLEVDLFYDESIGDLNFIVFNSTYDYLFNTFNGTVYKGEVPTGAHLYFNYTETFSSYLYWAINNTWIGIDYSMQVSINNISSTEPDDPYEENDNSGETFLLGYGEYDYLILADEDWFSFQVYNGTTIKIETYFNHTENDLDFTVFDTFNGFVDGSYGTENNESIELYCYETGQWKIQIYSANGYNVNPGKYNLTINIGDDGWEENDYQGESSELYPNYYPNLVMNDDADWYKIWVGEYDNLSLYLYYEPYANLTMDLYDQNGYWIQSSYDLYDGAQKLDFYNVDYSQYYFIAITGDFSIYDLDIWINQNASDDWAEENDEFSSSMLLDINSYYANLYQWDDDWYYIWLEPYDEFKVTIWCATVDWIPSLSFYNSEGSWIMDGTYTGDSVQIEFTEGSMGHYWYFRVSGPNLGFWYDIETSLNFGGDDWAEENDYQGEAKHLDWGYHGTFYQFDDDWFKFPGVSDGQTVHVRLFYDTYNDSLSASLVDQYGNPLSYDVYYQSDGRELIWNVYGSYPEFYLHVWGGNWGQYYDIDLWYESSGDDWAEENDYQGEAKHLDWGYHGTFYQFDEDWFQISAVSSGQSVHVYLKFVTYSTDLGIELLDEYGNPHGYYIVDHDDGKELIWDVDGYYSTEYIRITGPNNGDLYDLEVWWSDSGSTNDDWMEDNDEAQYASWLDAPGEWNDLRQGDDDYYRFHAPAGTIHIEVDCHQNILLNMKLLNAETLGLIRVDRSTDDGFLVIDFNYDSDRDYIIKITGDNSLNWYNLRISFESSNPSGSDDGDGSGNGTSPNDNPFSDMDLSSIPGYSLPIWIGFTFLAVAVVYMRINRRKRK